MTALGAPDPEGWARSEEFEDFAQEARWLLIRTLWKQCIEDQPLPGNAHADALIAAGADPGLVMKATKYAAYGSPFTAIYVIDGRQDDAAPWDTAGWQLMENRRDENDERQLTGREVGALYESLRQGGLTGNDGSDFLPS